MTPTDYEAIARDAGLERVGARPPLGQYLAEMWRRRAFATSLAKFRIQAQMSENRLGLAWVVLNPLLMAALYGTIFGIILPRETRPDGVNFVPFVIVGVFIFQFFSKSFADGAKSITGNASLVRSLNFPRMLLPLALIIQQLIELIPMLLVMGIIVLGFGEPLTWWWLLVIPTMLLMAMFNLGIALLAARLTVHIRDLTQVIPLITRLFFYASGIFYSLEEVLSDQPEWMLWVAQVNPVHDYITIVRDLILGGINAPGWMWFVASGAAVVTLAVGIVFFWRAEERYGHD
ncbi:ABC transporter permease [Demequina sp. NBRC 110055]|uniref:ABC transporter permease n=1 Tax=Demequina sp. NBRC 110055 TaxID=1570344 RepID=UPI001F190685|nr:ABC transporter permease [Demequina sp. NBRC 110055]